MYTSTQIWQYMFALVRLHCLHYMFALVKKKAELIFYVCIDVFALIALVMQVGEVRA